MRYRLISLAMGVILAGCAGTPFKWSDARQIDAGMTKAEVTSLVGPPYRVSTTPNGGVRYVWVWVNSFSGTRTLVVDFDQSGRAIQRPPIPQEFTD